eukprot:1150768-Pelagomonas_calceolata.AAC.7
MTLTRQCNPLRKSRHAHHALSAIVSVLATTPQKTSTTFVALVGTSPKKAPAPKALKLAACNQSTNTTESGSTEGQKAQERSECQHFWNFPTAVLVRFGLHQVMPFGIVACLRLSCPHSGGCIAHSVQASVRTCCEYEGVAFLALSQVLDPAVDTNTLIKWTTCSALSHVLAPAVGLQHSVAACSCVCACTACLATLQQAHCPCLLSITSICTRAICSHTSACTAWRGKLLFPAPSMMQNQEGGHADERAQRAAPLSWRADDEDDEVDKKKKKPAPKKTPASNGKPANGKPARPKGKKIVYEEAEGKEFVYEEVETGKDQKGCTRKVGGKWVVLPNGAVLPCHRLFAGRKATENTEWLACKAGTA